VDTSGIDPKLKIYSVSELNEKSSKNGLKQGSPPVTSLTNVGTMNEEGTVD
jgi:hypothetical protein